MASNLFSAGGPYMGRTAAEIKADQARARTEDTAKDRTARAAGRDRRSIGKSGGH
ncbi:hypothetical protein GCM10010112_43680 [Actinoplanes lobatus]|uniref:Uncharacterized protein n=1 Tax=Actinoplanes lobatus TaxID=113568 RepID=A0A7W7HBQ1_9ACTN|nr:hypothetical protein [Actinoplanes lobatus]MBB4747593.1 hypothetical protein [Actinoplanes lobatus]GGN73989.1 hypothetical protein GCM10010112_43680 [Actinoplanes lobatus]GIE39846.1 hypothetical protein Alo02nite_27440 [Actinoplanes lobatus]